MGHVVRRLAEPRRLVRAPLGPRAAGRRGGGVPRRERRPLLADVPRAVRGRAPSGGDARRARRRAGRPRRDLHADGTGGRGASHACAHVGAVQVPIFSGFAAPAIAQRLEDSGARVAVAADESFRRGRRLPMREVLEEARRASPALEHVVEWRREGVRWPAEVRRQPGTLEPVEVDAEHPCLIAYTSGTTGRPKGALHVRRLPGLHRPGVAYQTDVHPGETITSPPTWAGSWVPGRWWAAARSARASSTPRVAPDWPDDRLWRTIEAGVNLLGVSPTLIRALIPRGDPLDDPDLADRDRDDRRAVEPGARIAGCTSASAAASCRSSTSRAARRWARASSRSASRSRSRRARWAFLRSARTWTSSTPRAGRCAARSASSCASGPGPA